MQDLDDIDIIRRIRAGNTHAFSLLVDRHKKHVFSLALRMLKNREEAEETAQDVFIKLFKSLDSYKGDAKFQTWLYRVAYNACLDRIKKLNRERNILSIDENNIHKIADLDDALESLQKEERHLTVNACLQELPGEDHALLMMFYFEDKSLEEISTIIKLKPNHIKVKLFRLRKRLETLLSQRLEEQIIS